MILMIKAEVAVNVTAAVYGTVDFLMPGSTIQLCISDKNSGIYLIYTVKDKCR